MSQTEALSVHFSSRKKVRLKTRETRKGEQREQGRRFQREGPIDVKDLVSAIVMLTRGRKDCGNWRGQHNSI